MHGRGIDVAYLVFREEIRSQSHLRYCLCFIVKAVGVGPQRCLRQCRQ